MTEDQFVEKIMLFAIAQYGATRESIASLEPRIRAAYPTEFHATDEDLSLIVGGEPSAEARFPQLAEFFGLASLEAEEDDEEDDDDEEDEDDEEVEDEDDD